MQKIVLASGNKGKLRELQQRLGHIADFVPQSDFNIDTPEETGKSFLENALLKARYVSAKTGLPALADDSGLSVNYLDGAPGIYSARFARPDAEDGDNNLKLLTELAEVAEESRGGAFHCALVLIYPELESSPIICEGIWRGQILSEPKGENGFGYDPLFQPDGLSCSSAELDPLEKNRISHRGKAMSLLVSRLTEGSS
ncbi:MAG: RdgB/HAM1 family non-canonical purine NTP pyrophosphatase [Porticoccaceae bacterium]|jgi:XTP/dITP diphosphohydrolase|nr:RdgB/HAM1 family non-canonical purine NTP pyrophosphatase [Porticoccaceae bacterium]